VRRGRCAPAHSFRLPRGAAAGAERRAGPQRRFTGRVAKRVEHSARADGKQIAFLLVESAPGVADIYVPRSIFVGAEDAAAYAALREDDVLTVFIKLHIFIIIVRHIIIIVIHVIRYSWRSITRGTTAGAHLPSCSGTTRVRRSTRGITAGRGSAPTPRQSRRARGAQWRASSLPRR